MLSMCGEERLAERLWDDLGTFCDETLYDILDEQRLTMEQTLDANEVEDKKGWSALDALQEMISLCESYMSTSTKREKGLCK